MVTVTSGGQTKPSPLLGVYQCDSSGDYLSVGCIASGFSPAETLKFTWGQGTSDVVQYPAVQSGDTFSAVSKASVKRTEWDTQKPFTCTAEHPAGTVTLTVVKPVVPEQPPTLLLTAPTQGDLENGTATFICVASQFTPKDHSFTWKRDNAELTGRAKPTILNEEKSTVTVYNAISILELQAEEWLDMSSTIKCEFKHKGKIYSKEAKVADVTESEKVVITPPSSEDMLVRGAGDLQCKATGRKGFKGIRWTRGGKNITSTVEGQIDGSSMKATAKIDYSDWSKGTEYKCVVEHKLFPGVSKEYPYSRQNGGAKMCPSVYLLPPPESALDEWVTLTCYVKHFYPKDVVVYWLTDNEKLNNTDDFQQRTSNPIEVEKDVFGTDTKYSVYSQLVMKAGVWESGTPFTCIVFHEAINPIIRTISRSIDSSTNKPTLVNIQMNVPTLPGCMA